MHIIPVIDLMHGQVVQAIQGQRQHYRPIQSQLTDSHALLDVVAAILQVYPFDCVYIADLNAITRDVSTPNHRALIANAIQAFPQLQWWVDAGIQDIENLQAWQAIGASPIIASEGLRDFDNYLELQSHAHQAVLSLDFFNDGYHGPTELLKKPGSWPAHTILMSLPSVGANQGPDISLLASMQQLAPTRHFYSAGGVRNAEDIQQLQTAGAKGVLVASALHQGRLSTQDIARIMAQNHHHQ